MEINDLKDIKKYALDFDKAYPYFADHIECGKSLSQLVMQNVCFQKGEFYTFLPDNAIVKRLHELSFGGMIPTYQYDINGQLVGPSPPGSVPCSGTNTIEVLSSFTKKYLNQSTSNLAVIEDYNEEVSTPFARIENVRMIPYNDEVYYVLSSDNSISEIEKTVLTSEQVWHSLCILTSYKSQLHEQFSKQMLSSIVENTCIIIVSAYDGEGYAFWEKKD